MCCCFLRQFNHKLTNFICCCFWIKAQNIYNTHLLKSDGPWAGEVLAKKDAVVQVYISWPVINLVAISLVGLWIQSRTEMKLTLIKFYCNVFHVFQSPKRVKLLVVTPKTVRKLRFTQIVPKRKNQDQLKLFRHKLVSLKYLFAKYQLYKSLHDFFRPTFLLHSFFYNDLPLPSFTL